MNHNIWRKSYVMIPYYKYLFVKMKVFNYSELHFSEVISYKIPTLVDTIIIFFTISWPTKIVKDLCKDRKIPSFKVNF